MKTKVFQQTKVVAIVALLAIMVTSVVAFAVMPSVNAMAEDADPVFEIKGVLLNDEADLKVATVSAGKQYTVKYYLIENTFASEVRLLPLVDTELFSYTVTVGDTSKWDIEGPLGDGSQGFILTYKGDGKGVPVYTKERNEESKEVLVTITYTALVDITDATRVVLSFARNTDPAKMVKYSYVGANDVKYPISNSSLIVIDIDGDDDDPFGKPDPDDGPIEVVPDPEKEPPIGTDPNGDPDDDGEPDDKIEYELREPYDQEPYETVEKWYEKVGTDPLDPEPGDDGEEYIYPDGTPYPDETGGHEGEPVYRRLHEPEDEVPPSKPGEYGVIIDIIDKTKPDPEPIDPDKKYIYEDGTPYPDETGDHDGQPYYEVIAESELLPFIIKATMVKLEITYTEDGSKAMFALVLADGEEAGTQVVVDGTKYFIGTGESIKTNTTGELSVDTYRTYNMTRALVHPDVPTNDKYQLASDGNGNLIDVHSITYKDHPSDGTYGYKNDAAGATHEGYTVDNGVYSKIVYAFSDADNEAKVPAATDPAGNITNYHFKGWFDSARTEESKQGEKISLKDSDLELWSWWVHAYKVYAFVGYQNPIDSKCYYENYSEGTEEQLTLGDDTFAVKSIYVSEVKPLMPLEFKNDSWFEAGEWGMSNNVPASEEECYNPVSCSVITTYSDDVFGFPSTPANTNYVYLAYTFASDRLGDVNGSGNVDVQDVKDYREWIVGAEFSTIDLARAGDSEAVLTAKKEAIANLWSIKDSAEYMTEGEHIGEYQIGDEEYTRLFFGCVADVDLKYGEETPDWSDKPASLDDSCDLLDIIAIRMALTSNYGYTLLNGESVVASYNGLYLVSGEKDGKLAYAIDGEGNKLALASTDSSYVAESDFAGKISIDTPSLKKDSEIVLAIAYNHPISGACSATMTNGFEGEVAKNVIGEEIAIECEMVDNMLIMKVSVPASRLTEQTYDNEFFCDDLVLNVTIGGTTQSFNVVIPE